MTKHTNSNGNSLYSHMQGQGLRDQATFLCIEIALKEVIYLLLTWSTSWLATLHERPPFCRMCAKMVVCYVTWMSIIMHVIDMTDCEKSEKMKHHEGSKFCLRTTVVWPLCLRASAWETGADLEMMVSRFCSKSVHKVVMWTYVICQSFSFSNLFPAEFWISAPQGSSKADFQCNFGHFSISLLATYN